MSNPAEVTTKIGWQQALYAVERIVESEDGGAFCLYDAERLRGAADGIERMLNETKSRVVPAAPASASLDHIDCDCPDCKRTAQLQQLQDELEEVKAERYRLREAGEDIIQMWDCGDIVQLTDFGPLFESLRAALGEKGSKS